MNGPGAAAPRLPGAADLPPAGSRVHLIGIRGAGMRGLALLLHEAGYAVDGCDASAGDPSGDLGERGIEVERAHGVEHVRGAGLVVRSSAVPAGAPEVAAAAAADIPVMRRARALGALLNGRPMAGIAGTHGKTTITGMTGYAAEAAGLDPLVVIGGRVGAWGGYARLGGGPVVVEADEYDRSFLQLSPTLAVVSSLEAEHLESYGGYDALRAAFSDFAGRARGGGGLIYCHDDEGARGLARPVSGARGYGFGEDSWCRIESKGPRSCRLAWPDGSTELKLELPGRHNQLNAAAAFLATISLGGDPSSAARGLANFPGVDRRLQLIADRPGLKVFDDYAHHPSEVEASLAALRDAYPAARLAVCFQPHLFTRTRDFAAEFAEALMDADEAWVLPVYPAREPPLPGVTSRLITDARTGPASGERGEARSRGAAKPPGRGAPQARSGAMPATPAGLPGLEKARSIEPLDRERAVTMATAKAGLADDSVLVFMGAGDVTEIASEAVELMERRLEASANASEASRVAGA